MNSQEAMEQRAYQMQRQLMAEQAAMQSMQREQGQSYTDSLKDYAEYVREFSRDQAIVVEDGEYKSGTVPANNLIRYWGINGSNFVFANIDKKDKNERRRIRLMELQLELADSMYEINFDALDKVADRNVKDNIVKSLSLEKADCINNVNQKIHTFARVSRAYDGKERELMVTKSLVAGTTGSGTDKRRGGIGAAIAGFFKKG